MNKLIKFLKESNHYKHLIGGFIIGLLSLGNLWTCLLSVSGVAGALEFKDRAHGGAWDWIDFAITVCGGLLGFLLIFCLL